MRRRLATGDHSFLREIDFERHTVDEALHLGEGAPYLFALAFQSIGLDATARELLRLQVTQGDSPWDALAMPPLLQTLNRDGDYEAAHRLARQYLEDSPETIGRDLVRKSLVEALYWARDDRAALQELSARFPTGRSAAHPEIDAELALFKAVLSSRVGEQGWQALYLRLCLDHAASAVHVRVSQFVAGDDQIRAALPPPAQALLEAKAAIAAGQPVRALGPLETAIGGLEEPPSQILLREAAAAYQAAGEAGRGARFLVKIARAAGGTPRLAAMEAAGRLYRAAGAGGEAAALLSEVAAATSDTDQRDRVTWVLADMAAGGSARAAMSELLRGSAGWSDPLYFDDLVDSLATRMLADGDRDGLRTLFDGIARFGIPSRIRLYYILHRLGDDGLPDPRPIVEGAATTVSEDYYRLLIDPAPGGGRSEEASGESAPGDMDFLLSKLVEFGLHDRAVELVHDRPRSVSRAAKLAASLRLAEGQRYRDAISLAGSGFPWEAGRREAARAAYPRAFEREITELARGEALEDRLLFAVAREESAFDPAIVSTAGAVGLTQLLPSTAAEEARRLRLRDYDLREPRDNLSIGFHYLARLVRLQESVPFGLAAYNGGLTRVRLWKRQYAHLPPDLLLEAIPFEETRHYVRKVLVSAATYGELYERIPASRTVQMFFPPAQ